MSVNDINKYRKALLLTKEIKETLAILDEADKKLKKYARYTPILNCLEAIYNAKMVLRTHYAAQDLIVQSRGRITQDGD